MSLKRTFYAILGFIGINLLLLVAASVLDIVASALMPRFSSPAFMITCFAVAGIFSGLFCYSYLLESLTREQRQRASLYVTIVILVFCGIMFILIGPLSGSEYNWPFRSFAITEALTALLLWKGKFHEEL